ncbi:hypothetical protein KRB99_000019 [Salmonella enterica]|nr:hypothetical protein [Salmonella enterica]
MKITKAQENLILEQVLHSFAECEDSHATALERNNRSYLYYNAKLPGSIEVDETGIVTGDYVEPVMYQFVQEALPQLLDSYTEDDHLAVVFRSGGAFKNAQRDMLITDNINKLFLRDNPGYEVLETLIKQTLITGDSFPKCFIEESTKHDEATADDWIEVSDLMSQLAEGWQIDLPIDFVDKKEGSLKGFDWKKETIKTMNFQTQQPTETEVWLIRGKIPLIKKERKLVIEAAEISDLWINTENGSDFKKCRYIAHRIKTTAGDAILKGFDKEKIKRASRNEDENLLPDLYFSDVDLVPGEDYRSESTDPNERFIDIIEHYTYSSLLHPKGETRLYQVTTTRSEFLNVEEITRLPFVHGQCETLLGSFWGASFYDRCYRYQDMLSNFMRMELQAAKMDTWPAYQAAAGNYKREHLLQLHRPGAVIEVGAIGSVEPFKRNQLTDTFYKAKQSLLESANTTLSSRNGATDFSNGVDRTSAKTVALGVYQEGLDGNTLSKNIARTLIEPLYSLIYQVMRDEGLPLEGPDGQPVEGVTLPPVGDFICDINTSADDLAQANAIMQIGQWAAQMAQANMPYMTPQNIHSQLEVLYKRIDLDPAVMVTDPQQTADPHAAAEQAEQAAIMSEFNKIKLEREKVGLRKDAVEVALKEAQIDETIKDGDHKRAIKLQESLTAQAKVMADKSTKDGANAVKAQDVAVKAHAVEVEKDLALIGHAKDIAAPIINGVR